MGRFTAVARIVLAGCLVVGAASLPVGGAAAQDGEAGRPDEQVDAAARAAAEASNAFAIDLYRAVAKPDENLFFSPASVSLAVGFAYRGARGETAAQLREVMHFPAEPAAYLEAVGRLNARMNFAGPGRELHSANAIWVRQDIPLVSDYEADMRTQAEAALHRVAFKADPEAARREINRWVAGQTAERIEALLAPGVITKGTGAVLVNAMYWNADWEQPFNTEGTKVAPFTRLDGTTVPTELMTQRSRFEVLKKGRVSGILLPYAGDEVDMAVFLPEDGDLASFERGLTAHKLADWLEDLASAEARDTVLTLPKMHLDWHEDLAEVIRTMGAPTPFSDGADFSAMAQLPVPGGDAREVGLKISHVIHQANLDVDEKGSEAAAATAVVMDAIVISGVRGPPPPPPFVFRADKPFFFVLRDRRAGLILFAGRYVDPAAQEGASPD